MKLGNRAHGTPERQQYGLCALASLCQRQKTIWSDPVSRHERLVPYVVDVGIAWAQKWIIHSACAVVAITHVSSRATQRVGNLWRLVRQHTRTATAFQLDGFWSVPGCRTPQVNKKIVSRFFKSELSNCNRLEYAFEHPTSCDFGLSVWLVFLSEQNSARVIGGEPISKRCRKVAASKCRAPYTSKLSLDCSPMPSDTNIMLVSDLISPYSMMMDPHCKSCPSPPFLSASHHWSPSENPHKGMTTAHRAHS